MKADFMTLYKGVPIFFANGDYMIEDGERIVRFPTEEEAMEYVDEKLGL